jgi:UDP-N-acetylmuramoyl-tripeptide--D-alanyl-D-alanine ligase
MMKLLYWRKNNLSGRQFICLTRISHRKYLNLPIIALTGSNGKTTTKELIHVVLSKNMETKQRLVTSIIISCLWRYYPLQQKLKSGLLKWELIIKMKLNFFAIGYAWLWIYTNFGKAHLEGFGGVAGVMKVKWNV